MLETVAGRYYARELITSRPEPVSASAKERDSTSEEMFEYDHDYLSEDMDGLSDSASTRPSHSRPTTPSDQPFAALLVTSTKVEPVRTRSTSTPLSDSDSSAHFTVAKKAIHILGLVPGTLQYAKACLESARDEARRLSDISDMPSTLTTGSGVSVSVGAGGGKVGQEGKSSKKMDRARKVLSMTIPGPKSFQAASARSNGSGGGAVPSVILSAGGEEEEARRERRRKVADGVLHWQKEVRRLEEEREREMMGFGRNQGEGGIRRRGTTKKFRR